MNHSKEWHDFRKKGWGGSDATILMTGTPEEITKLNHIKRGLCEGDDLSNVLPVQMGNATEALNRQWFENTSGFMVSTKDCEYIIHEEKDYMRANIDGHICGSIFEAKYHGGNSSIAELAEKYYWQLQHYMYVVDAPNAYISVIFGHYSRHDWLEIDRDDEAIEKWLKVAAHEWQNVLDNKEPDAHEPEKVQISLDDMRELDVSGSNFESDWDANATVWAESKQAFNDFKQSEKNIKELIPDDVKRIWGSGIEVKRSKNGALRIREVK